MITRRWTYALQDDLVLCELVYEHGAFEVRTFLSNRAPTEVVERYAELAPALLRQCEVEAALINSGWTLENYVVER